MLLCCIFFLAYFLPVSFIHTSSHEVRCSHVPIEWDERDFSKQELEQFDSSEMNLRLIKGSERYKGNPFICLTERIHSNQNNNKSHTSYRVLARALNRKGNKNSNYFLILDGKYMAYKRMPRAL